MCGERGRRRALELDRRPGVRVAEAEPRGVEAQSAERVPARAVPTVPDDRVTELRQLDADLVAPPGPEAERHPCHVRSPLDHAVAGDRDARPASLRRRPARVDGPDAKRAFLQEDVLESPLIRGDHALDDRDVAPLRGAGCELHLEALLRLQGLRDDQEPRGLPVQPMDDERPAGLPRPLEVGPHQTVGGALTLVLGPDREQARRLLDHEQRRVLVDEAEKRGQGGRGRGTQRDAIGGGHGRAGIAHDHAGDPHTSGDEPRAEAAAGRGGELRAKAGEDGSCRCAHRARRADPSAIARTAGDRPGPRRRG